MSVKFVPSCLHLQVCTLKFAPSALHLQVCTFSFAPSGLPLQVCTFRFSPSSLSKSEELSVRNFSYKEKWGVTFKERKNPLGKRSLSNTWGTICHAGRRLSISIPYLWGCLTTTSSSLQQVLTNSTLLFFNHILRISSSHIWRDFHSCHINWRSRASRIYIMNMPDFTVEIILNHHLYEMSKCQFSSQILVNVDSISLEIIIHWSLLLYVYIALEEK